MTLRISALSDRWLKMRILFQCRLGPTAVAWALLLAAFSAGVRAADSTPAVLTEAPVLIPHPLSMLLRAESITNELGLSDGQKAAVEKAVDQADLALWRLRDLPLEERNRSARPLLETLQGQLAATLAPRQLARLDQLVLRASGLWAALDPGATAALGLSDAQQRKILAALTPLTRSADPDGRLRAQAERSIPKLLSDRQRRMFTGLLGPPFDLASVRMVACQAPELEGVTAWINSDPLTLAQLRGKVVVVHFYTFGCINCVRNLPHYNDWYERFDGGQCVLIGIHRPETKGEYDLDKVRQKAAEAGLKHAIAVDNESRNWDAWANRVWPSVYLIDKDGFVRYWWYGELNWQGTPGEKWMRDRIAALLAEPAQTAPASP
jgi:peroxiredoxin